jgi:hypothetical protein
MRDADGHTTVRLRKRWRRNAGQTAGVWTAVDTADRQISPTSLPMDGLGNSREEVALSGIVDLLTWRHALEPSQDSNYLRPSQRVVVYPKFLDNLDSILSYGDISSDPIESRWPAYEAMLTQLMSWPVDVQYTGGQPRFRGG